MVRQHKKLRQRYNLNTFPTSPKKRYKIIKAFDLYSDFHHDLTKYLQALIKVLVAHGSKETYLKVRK